MLLAAMAVVPVPAWAATAGEVLAQAARRQVGVTTGYDPAYRRIAYPNGDVPRATGVCTDVVIRAARDGWKFDLQRSVHEDMASAFTAYPRLWGLSRPDPNIDQRRVPNLETYWDRQSARVWRAKSRTSGAAFPEPLHVGDILTWRLVGNLPHVGVVVAAGDRPRIVHNIGQGARDELLGVMAGQAAAAHYRWRPSGA